MIITFSVTNAARVAARHSNNKYDSSTSSNLTPEEELEITKCALIAKLVILLVVLAIFTTARFIDSKYHEYLDNKYPELNEWIGYTTILDTNGDILESESLEGID